MRSPRYRACSFLRHPYYEIIYAAGEEFLKCRCGKRSTHNKGVIRRWKIKKVTKALSK